MIKIPKRTERRFDQVTLAPAVDYLGCSRIHRHHFAQEVVRLSIAPEANGTQLDGPRQLIADGRSCLIANLPFAQMSELAALGRIVGTFAGLMPTEAAGIGLLTADVLFTHVEQARRWLFAVASDTPAGLLAALRQTCPNVKAVVLILTSSVARIAAGGEQQEARASAATLPLWPRMLDIAEVGCHLLGGLSASPTARQLSAVVGFALEAAASSGGLENFPALRRRCAAVRDELLVQKANAGEVA